MMEILDIAMQDEKIRTMKLAFRCTGLEMVIMDLHFDGNRLAVDVSVANDRIRHLFEEEFYDFLYRFKKNNYIISSLNIHVGEEEKSCTEHHSVQPLLFVLAFIKNPYVQFMEISHISY